MRIFGAIFLLGFLVACQGPSTQKQSALAEIKSLEKEMRALDYLDTALAIDLAGAYQNFLVAEGSDSLKPYYHLKLANLYRHWPGFEKEALKQYWEVKDTYTYHEVAPRALLSLGLFYEDLGDKERAVAAYQEFLERFPSHEMANQALSMQEMLLNEKVTDIQRVQEWKKNSVNK